MNSVETGHRERVAIDPEEYEAGRAVFDALPPGLYIHCSKCKGWYVAGAFGFDTGGVYCERCMA